MTDDKSAAPERLETLLRELITEQSCGEWDDKTIEADVQKFLPRILALLDTSAVAAAPQPSAIAALQVIADLPTGRTEEVMEGQEQAYRAVEALFATPPQVVCSAAPQPAIADREALVNVIEQGFQDARYMEEPRPHEPIADALLARGLRLPTDAQPETLAWAVVGEDGDADDALFGREAVEALIGYLRYGKEDEAADLVAALRDALDRAEKAEADQKQGQLDYCALMERHDAQFNRAERAEAERDAAYKAGQEDMRERATQDVAAREAVERAVPAGGRPAPVIAHPS